MAQQCSDPIHKTINDLPYFGDTTSNQALVLSHVFAKIDTVEPTYPNYTLPAANMSQPPPPTNPPNMTLIMAPTSVGLANGPRTGCFLSAQRSVGNIANESSWARDESGLRTQWLMGGLSPSTNYTAFVLQDTTRVSGPIYFTTKSGQLPFFAMHLCRLGSDFHSSRLQLSARSFSPILSRRCLQCPATCPAWQCRLIYQRQSSNPGLRSCYFLSRQLHHGLDHVCMRAGLVLSTGRL